MHWPCHTFPAKGGTKSFRRLALRKENLGFANESCRTGSRCFVSAECRLTSSRIEKPAEILRSAVPLRSDRPEIDSTPDSVLAHRFDEFQKPTIA
jgi:hypothetical protein